MNFLKSKILYLNNLIYNIIIIFIIAFDLFAIHVVKNYYYEPFFDSINNKKYCFSDHSVNRVIVKGWINKSNNYYYFDEISGEMCIDEFKTINGEKYYFDTKGILVTNKKQYDIDGILYSIDKNGVISVIKNNK